MSPLILGFIARKDFIYLFFILTLSAFCIYLIILTFKTHQIIKNAIQLQFENDELLASLSDAKNKLELSNVRLKQDATHDPLTRVANRHLFEINFAEAIKTAAREHKILALLYLDLDRFKEVNDQYGHDAGDQLLLIVVERLVNVLRARDIVSRLGGDELTIILENMENVQAIADIAERVCDVMREPVSLKEATVQVYASIGISIYPIDGDDMHTLLRVADHAMYYVKDHGGNNYHFNVQIGSK
jgi:diguanylate cyclase (GGDEF)-like protein